MQSIKQYIGLPKAVYVLFLATIVNRMGDFIYPFLTLFLKSKIGLDPQQISQIIACSTVLTIVGIAIGGKVADCFNRKKVYVLFTAMSIGLMIICGVIKQDFKIVYLLVLSQFFLSIATPAMDAMKIDLTVKENRQTSFSLIYLGINIGVAVGQVIAGILFANHIRILFLGDALTSIIALLLICIYIKSDCLQIHKTYEIVSETHQVKPVLAKESMIRVMLQKPTLVIFCLVCSVLCFIYAQVNFLLPLQLEGLYNVADGSRYFGYLIAINAISVVIMTPWIVSKTKKYRAITNILLAAVCYTVGFSLFGLWISGVGFVIGTVLWTIGEILYSTNAGVYIANHAPEHYRARFQSIYEILKKIGKTLAPIIMGQYLLGHSIVQAWHIIGMVGIIDILFILWDMKQSQKKVEAALVSQ